MVIEALFIGLIVGFLFYELTGVSPGGIVAPGYIALSVMFPERIAVTVALAVVVWGMISFLSRHLILYGRRTLLLALVLGFSLKVLVDHALQPVSSNPFDLQSIGYVIPGLIAHEMRKQHLLPTLSAVVIVTVLTYLVLVVAGYVP